MNLKKLVLEGYGPFIEETEVDFTHLQFFCIQGKNGSGKSTLIDSLFFALWNESGKECHLKDLFSAKARRTRVFLEFEMDLKTVRIERKTEKSKTNHFMEIEEPGKEKQTFTGAKEVTRAVSEELGLKKDFMQRAFVIPQGRFDEILKSGNQSERQALLEMAAGGWFEKIKTRIADQKKEADLKYAEARGAIQEINPEQFEADLKFLRQNLEETQRDLFETEKQMKTLQRQKEQLMAGAELYQRYEKNLKQLAEHEKEESYRQQQRRELEKKKALMIYFPRYVEIIEKQKHESQLKQEEESLKKQISDLTEKREALQLRIQDLKALLEEKTRRKEAHALPALTLWNQLKQKREEMKGILSEIKKNEEGVKALQSKEQQQHQNLEKAQKELSVLETFLSQNPFSKETLLKLREFQKTFTHLESLLKEQAALKTRIEKMRRELQEEIQKEEGFQKNLALLKEQHRKDFEGLQNALGFKIRAGLKDQDLCPVCGHIYHTVPEKSKTPLSHADQRLEESLKQLENEIRRFEGFLTHSGHVKDRLTQSLKEEEGEVLKKQAEIDLKEKEMLGVFGKKGFDFWEALKAEEEKESRFNGAQTQRLEAQNRRDILLERQEAFIQEKKRLNEALKDLQAKKSATETDGRALRQELSERLSLLGIEAEALEKGGVETRIHEFQQGIKTLEQSYEALRTEEAAAGNRFSGLSGQHENLLKTLEDLKKDLSRKTLKLKEDLEKAGFVWEDFKEAENFSDEGIEKAFKENQEYFYRLEDLRKTLKENQDHARFKDYPLQIKAIDEELLKLETQKKSQSVNLGSLIQREKEAGMKWQNYLTRKESLSALEQERLILQELDSDFKAGAFPAFYARLLMERIVDEANDSFLALALSGRYRLSMKEGKDEFMIEDQTLGLLRAADTLSGGERFLVSFALSFAFSRILGERVGIFFIDEGFGVLDEENRSIIKEVFETVAQDRSRKIGVITHIPEIAEAIAQKIQVTAGERGSTLEILV